MKSYDMFSFWTKLRAFNKLYYHLRVVFVVRKWLKNTAKPPLGVYLRFGPHTVFLNERGDFSWSELKTVEMIICAPNKLGETLEDLSLPSDKNNWQELLATEEIVVYEQNVRTNELPLRLGITDTEKKRVSDWARKVVSATLRQEAVPEVVKDGRLATESATVDVALWFRGELRGSQIVSGASVYEAVATAARRAVFDNRFKPVALADLAQLRIEIAYMDDLLIPLPRNNWLKQDVLSYSSLGYRLRTPISGGWYVPAIFNILPLNTLAQVFYNLTNKINFQGDKKQCELSVFSTQIWIEDAQITGQVCNEIGPLVVPTPPKEPSKIALEAARHLCYNQENDGHFLPKLYPDRRAGAAVDFVRLASVLYALGEYAHKTKDKTTESAVVAGYEYLHKYIFTYPNFTPSGKALILAYALRVMQRLNKHDDKKLARQELLALLPKLHHYEPILFSQISFTWLNIEDGSEEEQNLAYKLIARVEKDFRERLKIGKTISLALYPELITLLPKVPAEHCDINWVSADEVLDWYLRQQLPDGSFPSVSGSRFAYVRGTAKILECLPDTCVRERALVWQWLSLMQYSQDNSYHIPLSEQPKFIGGFRHDVFDRSAWFDAVSHTLLAFCREKS